MCIKLAAPGRWKWKISSLICASNSRKAAANANQLSSLTTRIWNWIFRSRSAHGSVRSFSNQIKAKIMRCERAKSGQDDPTAYMENGPRCVYTERWARRIERQGNRQKINGEKWEPEIAAKMDCVDVFGTKGKKKAGKPQNNNKKKSIQATHSKMMKIAAICGWEKREKEMSICKRVHVLFRSRNAPQNEFPNRTGIRRFTDESARSDNREENL